MRTPLAALALAALLTTAAQAQTHGHHHGPPMGAHGAHPSSLGPAGSTYDLRWLDAMVQHHTGALRMSEAVFNGGSAGVGALARSIWNDQAQEIKAMGQWRRAWYPTAPLYPVVLRSDGDPNSLAGLERMDGERMAAMRMTSAEANGPDRITTFLEGMLAHHGGALQMAHDALAKSHNPTIRRLARQIIATQRGEILSLRRMLRHDGLNKPEYYAYDPLFSWHWRG